MAKIDRFDGNVQPFAQNATGNNRTAFGSDSQSPVISDALDDNLTTEYLQGWEFVGVSGRPPLEYFNGSMYTNSALSVYLYQMGVPEWNTNQEYFTNSIANEGGFLYRAVQDNTGNQPSLDGGSNWEEVNPPANIPNASTTVAGVVEKATQTEMNSGTANKYPDAFSVKTYVDNELPIGATTTVAGVVEKATPTELVNGTADKYPDAGTVRDYVVNNAKGITKYSGAVISLDILPGAVFYDLDLSSIVGTNRALVFLKIETTNDCNVELKTRGDIGDLGAGGDVALAGGDVALASGTASGRLNAGDIDYYQVITDSSGFIEYKESNATTTPDWTITILTYTAL